MSEARSDAARPTTAGGLLRQARQAQGMHIGVLAAAIKVTQRKLESLEGDRFDELPDATFTRALAQTVCRSLKIDPVPVLALLPPPTDHRLEHLGEGINAPFRERSGSSAPHEWASLLRPAVLAPVLVLLAALAVYLAPAGWLSLPTLGGNAATAPAVAPASAVVEAVPPPTPAPAPPAAAAEPAVPSLAASAGDALQAVASEAAASAPASTPVSGSLQLQATADSWIEVLDGRGQALLARTVRPGEVLGFDGVMPLKVKIGNAAATQVVFRGQPLALGVYTRDNIARLELR